MEAPKNILTIMFSRINCCICLLSLIALVSSSCGSKSWDAQVKEIKWVAYSPPLSDPTKKVEATEESILKDLLVLKKAGFTGLITYGTEGIMGKKFPSIANSVGFKGIILGIWNPSDSIEYENAVSAAENPILLGYCVGNEGLNERYDFTTLYNSIQKLKEATGKMVTTTEQVDDYSDESLFSLGDWLFPNVHPYFHNIYDPETAVNWTTSAFDNFVSRTNKLVLFKEVGFPTDGDTINGMSENIQDEYYSRIEEKDINFVYFEAFDQPWKTHLPIEPYWGIFRSDRTPKLFIKRAMQKPLSEIKKKSTASNNNVLYIYKDGNYANNHFAPTGYMGDCGDIEINEVSKNKPYSGNSCIKNTYSAQGRPPNECQYQGPCKWAGVYWQQPPNNWGKEEVFRDKGINLEGFTKITFWSRAEKTCSIEFKVAGITGKYGDSQQFPISRLFTISPTWQRFEISLDGAKLDHIIGGFCWSISQNMAPDGAVFYLDEIRFESS